jgi:hypothetical protein
MLDWLVNIPLYGIAIMMLGIALYCGTKEDRDE